VRDLPRVVLDTNVFVAAGFRSGSASARIVHAVRRGELVLVWNEATRREARHVLEHIPHLAWTDVEPLFRPDARFDGPTRIEDHTDIPDVTDRKFAALAHAAGAVLVSSDHDLLAGRATSPVMIITPGELLDRITG
jgi:predicted nucleic acid-binding protein